MAKYRVVSILIFLFSLSGCVDLYVSDVEVEWNDNTKIARAEITNKGFPASGEFYVYFNGDEDPVSQNNRPQVVHRVNGLAAWSSIHLESNFAPLAHPDNHNLQNVHRITVIADPKNMVSEWDESNNQGRTVVPVTGYYNLVPDGSIVVAGDQWAGQTFTMTKTGTLAGIEVSALRCDVGIYGTLTMEVGQGSTAFGRVTKAGTDIPGPGQCGVPAPLVLTSIGPAYFDFSSLNQVLTSGQTYYFKLTTPSGPDFHLGINIHTYSGGTIIVNGNPGVHDFAFKIVTQP